MTHRKRDPRVANGAYVSASFAWHLRLLLFVRVIPSAVCSWGLVGALRLQWRVRMNGGGQNSRGAWVALVGQDRKNVLLSMWTGRSYTLTLLVEEGSISRQTERGSRMFRGGRVWRRGRKKNPAEEARIASLSISMSVRLYYTCTLPYPETILQDARSLQLSPRSWTLTAVTMYGPSSHIV